MKAAATLEASLETCIGSSKFAADSAIWLMKRFFNSSKLSFASFVHLKPLLSFLRSFCIGSVIPAKPCTNRLKYFPLHRNVCSCFRVLGMGVDVIAVTFASGM